MLLPLYSHFKVSGTLSSIPQPAGELARLFGVILQGAAEAVEYDR
jgi:hypothetical protein